MVHLRLAKTLLVLSTTLVGLSCSDGNTRDSNPLTGRTTVGDALIWLDLDGNFAPDPGEPTGRTAASGDYSLDLPADLPSGEYNLVVHVEAGKSTSADGRPSVDTYLLAAPPSFGDVSIWTTVATALIAGGQATGSTDAQAKVRNAFELPPDFDFFKGHTRLEGGLSHVALRAYVQKAAQGSLRPDAEPKDVLISAGRDVIASAAVLRNVAHLHTVEPESPPLKGPFPVQVGVFHGDFSSLPINSEMAYGIGLDEANYALKGVCTEVVTHFDGLCANDYAYTFDLVESVHELSRHLSIGASAQAGVSVAGFDVVSVSGGFEFLRDTEFKDNALYILFRLEERKCGYPVVAALKSEWESNFSSDYETFRQTCGDRYLSSLTSGGVFAALVEVLADENTKIEDLRLSLSGKVLGTTVYKKTWKETLREIDRDFSTRTRVLSNLFTYSNNFLRPDQVFARFDEFSNHMKQDVCSGPEGWQKCAYLANFARYDTISSHPPGNAAAVRTKLANMQALETYFFEIADLLADVDEILIRPGDFNIGEDVDAFAKPNAWTLDGLMTWKDSVKGYQMTAAGQWDICRQTIQNCTKGPEALALPSWLELKMALPTRKFLFPESCQHLAEQFGVSDDGERWLFLGGNMSMSYRAYCRDMATSAPKTYLKLFNHSADVSAPSYNYSTLHYSAGDGSNGIVTRTFEALLVEPRTDSSTGNHYLRILAGQTDYTSWSATPISEEDSQSFLAKALGVLQAQGQGGATGTANLNMEGTPFILSPSLEIGTGDSVAEIFFAVTAGGKDVGIAVRDGAAVVKGEILLEWQDIHK